ncbi:MAG TPA: hypothetical protein VE615_11505 [Gaiellaceae bacterium]|jgi:hypothetical protein|nr:hypothetical protein [Gaiellaceae bacterium]
MGFFRRDRPAHEQLAEEGGIELPADPREEEEHLRSEGEKAVWLAGGLTGIPTPTNRAHPLFEVAGIHGVPRPREWDAVASAEAPDLPGDEIDFVVLDDGTLIVDQDLPEDALSPVADSLELTISPPYHAVARRGESSVWAAGAMEVAVVKVPEDVPGDEVALAVQGDERTLLVDDERSDADVPTLEEYGYAQHDAFVLRASRLDGLLWEVTVNAL